MAYDEKQEKEDKALPGPVAAALAQGRKIQAIKFLCEQKGIGLEEAKDRVEEYIESHPALKEQLNTQSADAFRGLFRWIVLAAVLAAAYGLILKLK